LASLFVTLLALRPRGVRNSNAQTHHASSMRTSIWAVLAACPQKPSLIAGAMTFGRGSRALFRFGGFFYLAFLLFSVWDWSRIFCLQAKFHDPASRFCVLAKHRSGLQVPREACAGTLRPVKITS
jgi:hypothetical protein